MASDKSTKNKILKAASELFLANGFEGTSVKDITDKANVSISAVNYHFESKENLFKEIVTSFGKDNLVSVNKALKEPRNQSEVITRLELFLDDLIDLLFENYTQTIIVLKQVDFTKPEMAEAFQVFLGVYQSLFQFFTISKDKGYVRDELDPEFIAGMLLNHISNQMKSDSINKQYMGNSLKDEEYRSKWIHNSLSIMLHGCLESKNDKS